MTILLFGLATPLCLTRPADAAEYRVAQCGATTAEHEFGGGSNTPGLYVEDQCSSIAALSVHGVPRAHIDPYMGAGWSAAAPPGTTFTAWEAGFQSGAGLADGIAVYARTCDNVTCTGRMEYVFFGAQENWGAPVTKRWTGSGAVWLQVLVQCLPAFGGPDGCDIRQYTPGVDMFVPEMTLEDYVRPSSPSLTGGNLPGSGWESKRTPHSIAFSASDQGGGIDRVTATIDSGVAATYAAPCARSWGIFTKLRPCPLTVAGSLSIDIGGLSDGVHDMWLTAIDAGGQTTDSGPYRVRVDNTAPTAPENLQVVGGQGWRAHDGFVATWNAPPQPHAPVAAVRWRLCPLAGGPCRSGRQAGTGSSLDTIAVGRSGQYTLQTWLEDAAGNQDSTSARAVALRLDAEAPRLAFERQDPNDPLKIAVDVDDPLSGLADGEIQLRKEGTGTWQSIETEVVGQRLVSHVVDDDLSNGRYDLRARAVDGAGNEATGNQAVDDTTAVLRLPVRMETRLRAGVPAASTRRGVKRRSTNRLRHTIRLGRAKPVTMRGQLTSRAGAPVDGGSVEVYSAARYGVQAFTAIGVVHTDSSGNFSYQARPRRSTVFRFQYAGTGQVRGARADVTVGVPAGSTIRASDRSVKNGESVSFRGRLTTTPVPPTGKLVEVQAYFRRRWRTFSTVRADARGRWSFDYLFGGTIGTVLYRFRIQIPHESGYGFETGVSPVTRVTVHGP